ncbi:S41 family peptidase [Niabella insulamsoli]|uniref:S41 family peptidase n=1 Tax=Niabella insulamsoli TaxID=3144874 RepID=UPI0031FDA073
MLTKKWGLALLSLLFMMISCDPTDNVDIKPEPEPEPEPPAPVVKTYQELLADSLYKYARQIYYWNTLIPDSSVFKPLSFVRPDTMQGLENELLAITSTNSFEPYTYTVNGATITDSKYSYLALTSDLYGGGATSVISNQHQVRQLKMTLDGKENELGFTIGFARVSYLRGTPREMPTAPQDSVIALVRIVTKGSPAWDAGVRRGDLISKFNGNKYAYPTDLNQISNAINGNSLVLSVFDPASKVETDRSFTKAVYTFNPVYKDTLITVGAKKIAYVAYKSFTVGTNTEPALEAAFNKFDNATDLVVDLRYNGGGYVSSAAYFANAILPTSANGGVLFKEIYNATMQNKQATLLSQQPVYLNNVKQSYSYFDIDYSEAANTEKISKEGNFNSSGNITTVYFIVSSNTASASELLINSVKPYFNDVHLINAPFSASDNPNFTYGKPIGFFEIRLGKYSIYMSNFESKNKNNEGGYYDGMATHTTANDDIKYDLGNPSEAAFLAAIRRITGNSGYQPATSSVARSVYRSSSLGVDAIGEPTKIFDMVRTPGIH